MSMKNTTTLEAKTMAKWPVPVEFLVEEIRAVKPSRYAEGSLILKLLGDLDKEDSVSNPGTFMV